MEILAMKAAILDSTNNKIGEIKLPSQFEEEYRPDLIHRAVLAIQSHKRQGYAASETAGKRASAKLSRRRRDYRGSYGIGISRVPRKIMSRRGMRMNWVGTFAPGTVGGRRAHPPKSEKIWDKKINIKERRKAIRSALAATLDKNLVMLRNHKIPDIYPIIIEDKFENISKTKEIIEIFEKLGLKKELSRLEVKKIRSGRGKNRGRKYRIKKGPLLIVSKKCKLTDAAKNIQGVDVSTINQINVELLAPGSKAGRLTIYTQGAIEKLAKENLFM